MGVRCRECGAKWTPGWTGECPYCEVERLNTDLSEALDRAAKNLARAVEAEDALRRLLK